MVGWLPPLKKRRPASRLKEDKALREWLGEPACSKEIEQDWVAHCAAEEKYRYDYQFGPSVLPPAFTRLLHTFVGQLPYEIFGRISSLETVALVQHGVLAMRNFPCTLPTAGTAKMPALPSSTDEQILLAWASLHELDYHVADGQPLLRMAIEDRVESQRDGRAPFWMVTGSRG